MTRIYLSPPDVSRVERDLLLEAFDSNWIAPLGPQVDAFEAELSRYVSGGDGNGAAQGQPPGLHSVAVSSGTAALHLALLLLGVGPGDEVLTSSFTFVASANAIRYAGATPVFVDSEERSWNMDPDLLADELHRRARSGRLPKAVLVVDLYGQCADFERIAPLCEKHGVALIEDAAEALGARYRERAAGTFGAIGAFSFNGNKIITTGGGGMLVTRNRHLAERARFLATQARDPAPHYEHSELGYNYRLCSLLAAVGRGQLRSLDAKVARCRQINAQYQAKLAVPGIHFMPEPSNCFSTRWLTVLEVDEKEFGASPRQVLSALAEQDIEARPAWKPMHLQPLYRDYPSVGGSVSQRIFERGLCLPSGTNLADGDLERVADIVLGTRGS